VERVQTELKGLQGTQNINNIMINLCWNVLRNMGEQPLIVNKYLALIETTLVPLFQYMQAPEKIEFDEDILLIVGSLIKVSKGVTDTQMQLFPLFERVFEKYNNEFSHLFNTLNQYIIHGRQRLASNIQYVELVS
jgi:hypothetical protein